MKSLLLVGMLTLVGLGLVGIETAGPTRAVADTALVSQATEELPAAEPTISTNEGGCWDKCKTCEEKCRAKKDNDAKRACDESCWSTNDTCCAGVGGKGVYKMCGCTEK